MVEAARVLEHGKTPAQIVAEMAAKGIKVSERSLRAQARRLGACRTFGKAMILLPEHIDLIFGAPACPPENDMASSFTGAAQLGGRAGGLKARSDTTARALELLMRQSQKPKSEPSRTRRGNVLSLDEMRQSPRSS